MVRNNIGNIKTLNQWHDQDSAVGGVCPAQAPNFDFLECTFNYFNCYELAVDTDHAVDNQCTIYLILS
jgi:hypothetical protein